VSCTLQLQVENANTHELERRQTVTHTKEEIMAQAMCQAIAIKNNNAGWVYAVRRQCSSATASCTRICASSYLHVQDSQTVHSTWSTIGAFHVYQGRPASTPGTDTNPVMGLKTYWSSGYHNNPHCGPNFCCCYAR